MKGLGESLKDDWSLRLESGEDGWKVVRMVAEW